MWLFEPGWHVQDFCYSGQPGIGLGLYRIVRVLTDWISRSCLVRGGSGMVATLKSIEPMNVPCCATAGNLEGTQHSSFCHISHLLSITLHKSSKEIHHSHQINHTSNCFWLPLFCATIWKACLAAGLLKMSSSSRSVRYRMVPNKDDLVDSEINQVETDDHDADQVPKSRLSSFFNRQT